MKNWTYKIHFVRFKKEKRYGTPLNNEDEEIENCNTLFFFFFSFQIFSFFDFFIFVRSFHSLKRLFHVHVFAVKRWQHINVWQKVNCKQLVFFTPHSPSPSCHIALVYFTFSFAIFSLFLLCLFSFCCCHFHFYFQKWDRAFSIWTRLYKYIYMMMVWQRWWCWWCMIIKNVHRRRSDRTILSSLIDIDWSTNIITTDIDITTTRR